MVVATPTRHLVRGSAGQPYRRSLPQHGLMANLAKVNFEGSNLFGATFKGANLYEANLLGANISGAMFDEANLSNAIWIDGKKCALGSIGSCQ